MTTPLQTDPRRAARASAGSSSGGKPPLEMPVLFQLADLSQFKVLTPAAAPKVEVPPVQVAAAESRAANETPAAHASSSPAMVEGERGERAATATADPPPQENTSPPNAVPSAVKARPAMIAAEETSKSAAAPEPSGAIVAAATAAANGAIAASPEAPTPRDRALQRQRKPQEAVKKDWMHSHGKVIAIGFVIALIITIYASQQGGEPAPAPQNAAAVSAETSPTDEAAAAKSGPTLTNAHTGTKPSEESSRGRSPALLSETNPASGSETSPAPHAELQLPKVAEDAAQPGAHEPANAEVKSLFPWSEKGEARVAARPESPAATSPASPPATGESDARQVHPSRYAPPTSPPGPRNQEVGPNLQGPSRDAPASYPTTSPKDYRDFEGTQPQSAAPRPASRATPASYQNNDPFPRTSGPRYERTGSGLY